MRNRGFGVGARGFDFISVSVSMALGFALFAMNPSPGFAEDAPAPSDSASTAPSQPTADARAAVDAALVPALASGSSETSTAALVYEKFRENFASSYFGAVTGTNLKFQGYSPNPDGSDSGSLGVWNALGVGYKVLPDLQLDAQLVWDWFIAGGHRWVMNPPRVGASAQVVSTDSWSFWSNLNFELPVTDTAAEARLATSLGTFNELWFNPTRTGRLRFGAFHSLRVSFYASAPGEGEEPGDRLSGTITPLIRYRITSTLDAQVGYAVDYSLGQGESVASLKTGLQQIQPGFNWNVTPRLNVMPYLILQPQGNLDLASTSFGAWVSGTIL